VYGGLAGGVRDMVEDNPELQEIFTRMGGQAGIIDAYFASVMRILGLIAAGYAVSATLRLRSEESALRAEPVLATPVGRLRWAASHLTFTLLGSAAALAAGGLAAGLVHGLNSGRVGAELPRVFGAAMAQLPAVWLIAAIAVALFGLLPRFTALSWAVMGIAVGITMFGAVLDLSQWVMDLSPFTHMPEPGEQNSSVAPLAGLLALAVVLTAAGLAGFRRRDLALG
jgi:ABC-2 type transport system permease protein